MHRVESVRRRLRDNIAGICWFESEKKEVPAHTVGTAGFE
jgi:hypothetical protein